MLVLDVETANTLVDALVYDIGGRLIDMQGNIYHEFSFVIRDIFVHERDIMKTAYYAKKMPAYIEDLQADKRVMIDFIQARNYILRLMKQYNCDTVAAYNCSFDRNALNTTLRYLSKSKMRWFFPFSTEFICIWNMACNTICQTSEYKTFAETHRYYSNHGKNYRATAETVYAFITNNPFFEEEHRGLDDVKIECEIMIRCLIYENVNTNINRNCWQKVKRGAIALR